MFTEFNVLESEWNAATRYFDKNKNAVKYRRADSKLAHSFLQIGEQLVALANKQDPTQYLGKGGFSKVKLVKNQANEYFALKIKRNTPENHQADSAEWSLLTAMKRFFGTVTRLSNSLNSFFQKRLKKSHSFFSFFKKKLEKHYTLEKLITGETLKDALAAGKYRKADEALILAYKIIAAVKELHETYHYIHCDLKPSNIMVSGRGADIKVDLIDFGFAQKISGDQVLRLQVQQGTRDYIAPESYNPYDTAWSYSKLSDIYSLGITFGVIRQSFMSGELVQINGFLSRHLWPRETSPYTLEFNEFIKMMTWMDEEKRPLPTAICDKILHQLQDLKETTRYNKEMIGQFLESLTTLDGHKPSLIISTAEPAEPASNTLIANCEASPKKYAL